MGKNFNGAYFNQSPTVAEVAGAEIADVRNRILKYDSNGAVVLATAGTDIPLGIAIIEAGCNDITGAESGKIAKGDVVDILIKDIGFVIANTSIKKGQEVAAGENGEAVVASASNYVLGIALNNVEKNGYCKVQINKYQKGA